MGASRTNRLILAAAFAASLALHVGAAALLVGSSAGSTGFDARLSTASESEVTPGIAASDAVTVSWIGFSNPTPHAAPVAESDQAQVSPDAGEAARPVEHSAQQSAQQPSDQQAAQEVVQAAVQDAVEDAVETVRDRVMPVLERGTVLAEALRDQAIVAARRQDARQAAARAAEARAAREAAEGAREAIPDERDASATSTERDLVYRAGQPLAREGLQIATVRPVFDAATRVLELRSMRRQPVVIISFARDGTVSDVAFANGGTGIRSIDEPIKTAVFRWTARGSDLEALPANDPEASVTVRIRFSL